MAKRQYKKRSSYWQKFEKTEVPIPLGSEAKFEPELAGESFYQYGSSANYTRNNGGSLPTSGRRNRAANSKKADAYTNINNLISPFDYSAEGVDAQTAIQLCQKAYWGVAIFRNSVDMMSDFANSPLYLEGGNAESRKFIEAWLNKVKIWKLKDQFFREFYRSGNVFFYKINGKFDAEGYARYRNFTSKNEIPLRYITLNPCDMTSINTTSFEGDVYQKVLNQYEIVRLKNPQNDEDRELLKSLPDNVQQKIKNSTMHSGIAIQIDPSKLRYVFYKKQDYEPFAIPFGFPVLDDINFKMEMKKIDQAICRTIENVILLITMGNEPAKGGIAWPNLQAMQQLFANQSSGRVLVSDYTTKAEFIIPDLKKVIGPEKYEIINQDIKEGLQNIILSQEKFASTEIKAKMFLQRLDEARNAFLNDFLQPEIKAICKNFGFKACPQAKFQTIDLKDTAQVQRVITRMMELGILPPEEGMQVIETGVFPSPEDLKKAQERYAEDRKNGLYNPLVGGVPTFEGVEKEIAPNAPAPRKANRTPNAGRPPGAKTNASLYSLKNVKSVVDDISNLYSFSLSEARKTTKRLNKVQKEVLTDLCQQVVTSCDKKEWEGKVKACIEDNMKIMDLHVMSDINDIAEEHGLPHYAASLLYHSSQKG